MKRKTLKTEHIPMVLFDNRQRLLRIDEVAVLVGLEKPTIYKRLAAGDFPRPVKVSPGAARWPYGELLDWINRRPKFTRNAAA